MSEGDFVSQLVAKLPMGDNALFQGGVGLAGLGIAAQFARRLSGTATMLLRRHFLMTLEVTSKDPAYPWVLNWLNSHGRSTQHLSVNTVSRGEGLGFDLVPGPGRHLITYGNRLFLVDRAREHQTVNMTSGTPWERITLTALGRDPSCFEGLLREARQQALPRDEGTTTIYTSWGTEWRPFGAPRRKRPIESVVLGSGVAESVLSDMNEWTARREWYRQRGIPYRRGYLLHGPPGSGKTSFILALAGHMDRGICMLSLSDEALTDDRLALALSAVPPRCIVVLEDVDAAFVRRDGPRGSSVTFSGLLNCLDGVLSGEDRVVFMTTNHIERLDAALLRPGRVDLVSYLGDAERAQVEAFFRAFYGAEAGAELDATARDFAEKVEKIGRNVSMAHLQGFLMEYKDRPADAAGDAALARLRGQLEEASQRARAADRAAAAAGGDRAAAGRGRGGRQLTVDEVDRMVFNPQEGWEEQCGLK